MGRKVSAAKSAYTCFLEDELVEKLKALAVMDERPLSYGINLAIRKLLEAYNTSDPPNKG
jgi:hypothetical protein